MGVGVTSFVPDEMEELPDSTPVADVFKSVRTPPDEKPVLPAPKKVELQKPLATVKAEVKKTPEPVVPKEAALAASKILAIVSGKGGVGKTTTVASVGTILASVFKKKILVIDGNVTTSNLGLHLGFLYPPLTLHDVLDGKVTIDQAIYTHKSGLQVIPASLSIKRKARYEKLKEKLGELSLHYDLILIDGAAGIGEEVQASIRCADEVVVVTNPEITAVTAAIKVIETAKSFGIPVRGILLNKVKSRHYELTVKEIEESCDTRVLCVVKDDPAVPESIASRTPVYQYRPASSASRAFLNFAATLIGEKRETRNPLEQIFSRLASVFAPSGKKPSKPSEETTAVDRLPEEKRQQTYLAPAVEKEIEKTKTDLQSLESDYQKNLISKESYESLKKKNEVLLEQLHRGHPQPQVKVEPPKPMPPAPPPAVKPTLQPPESPAQQRASTLKRLYEQGLLSKERYDALLSASGKP